MMHFLISAALGLVAGFWIMITLGLLTTRETARLNGFPAGWNDQRKNLYRHFMTLYLSVAAVLGGVLAAAAGVLGLVLGPGRVALLLLAGIPAAAGAVCVLRRIRDGEASKVVLSTFPGALAGFALPALLLLDAVDHSALDVVPGGVIALIVVLLVIDLGSGAIIRFVSRKPTHPERVRRDLRELMKAGSATRERTGNDVVVSEPARHPENRRRVLLVGWDGATWDIIKPLMAEGKLPHLQRLMEKGSSGIMKSYMPPVSPVLWASIATGSLPSKHGVKDFTAIRLPGVATPLSELPGAVLIGKLLRSRRANWEAPVSSDTFQRPAFWQIASQLGGTVGVVGWWGSWPALEVNGFVVTDRVVYHPSNTNVDDLDSERGLTWPEPLFAAIRDQIRDPNSVTLEEAREFIDVKQLKPGYRTPHDPEHLFKIALSMSESYRKIGLDLYRKTKPDVFAIYFQGTDLVSHYMWQYGFPHEFDQVPPEDVAAYGECIRRFYVYQDRILGEFVEASDEDTCIVVLSDHGFAKDPQPYRPTHTGKHALEGMCVFSGAGVKRGAEFATTPHDVAPTILAITGTTLSQDMDGRVLTEIVVPETLQRFPVRYVQRYPDHYLVAQDWKSTETDREIIERLKALGYLQ